MGSDDDRCQNPGAGIGKALLKKREILLPVLVRDGIL
jgi:hypothetical protein